MVRTSLYLSVDIPDGAEEAIRAYYRGNREPSLGYIWDDPIRPGFDTVEYRDKLAKYENALALV